MSMTEKTLADIVGDDLIPTEAEREGHLKSGGSVSIWLPAKAKARYDRLQEQTGRRFSKKAREALLELITIAEARVMEG